MSEEKSHKFYWIDVLSEDDGFYIPKSFNSVSKDIEKHGIDTKDADDNYLTDYIGFSEDSNEIFIQIIKKYHPYFLKNSYFYLPESFMGWYFYDCIHIEKVLQYLLKNYEYDYIFKSKFVGLWGCTYDNIIAYIKLKRNDLPPCFIYLIKNHHHKKILLSEIIFKQINQN